MKKKIFSLLIISLSVFFITSCGKKDSNLEDDVILGDIVIDEEDIKLGDLTIYDNDYYKDDFAPKDENLYNNEVPEETTKKDDVSSEEYVDNKDDLKSEENTEKPKEEVSKYKTFDSVKLDHMSPEELYVWYGLYIASVEFFDESNNQLLADYYEYINNRFANDIEFSNYVLDNFIRNDFDMYFIQRPKQEDFMIVN